MILLKALLQSDGIREPVRSVRAAAAVLFTGTWPKVAGEEGLDVVRGRRVLQWLLHHTARRLRTVRAKRVSVRRVRPDVRVCEYPEDVWRLLPRVLSTSA